MIKTPDLKENLIIPQNQHGHVKKGLLIGLMIILAI